MSRDPDLSWDRDGRSFYRISQYIYQELQRVSPATGRRSRAERAMYDRLATTHDVLHDLWRELRTRGELNTPTMFSRDEEPS